MTDQEKLETIAKLLNEEGNEEDFRVYLDLAKKEILSWLYTNRNGVPSTVTDVPDMYEVTQVMAVVEGFSHSGAEGELVHNENGINRTFKHADMVAYIRYNVFPYMGV